MLAAWQESRREAYVVSEHLKTEINARNAAISALQAEVVQASSREFVCVRAQYAGTGSAQA